MKKWNISLLVFLISIFFLIGCSNSEKKTSEINLEQLSRVDIKEVNSDESYSEAIIITEKETVDLLSKIFEQIKWEQNVKAEMSRKEDVRATLFFNFDKNMPEKLVEYLIWFNQGNETATIIAKDENAYGTLEKENVQNLNDILLKNN
ncbi:hypothetical protein WAX74_01015 [Psychrobacillus sp. FJAT-51614]|uniref:Lipoprotein n=1 Tax=Psychrobacillus mangrovi TaxID=3117745 RepID=A0ABU8F2G1_9BACI